MQNGFSFKNDGEAKKRVGIITFHYEKTNFGANLVAYSMLEIVKKLGFFPQIINFDPFKGQSGKDKFISEEFYKFKANFFNMTPEVKKINDLSEMNSHFDSFIAGSDQVWNPKITRNNTSAYYLGFADSSKNIISYAASLGKESITYSQDLINEIKFYIDRFDSISVREQFAVDLVKRTFNPTVEPLCVLDPTLLLEALDYQKIIDSEDLENLPEKYIAFYFLNDRLTEEKYHQSGSFIELTDKFGLSAINCYGETADYLGEAVFRFNSVAKWLHIIKNSSVVITDSFHGVCFSIIFNKEFVFINKEKTLSNRISSLLERLNIQGRIFEKFEDIDVFKIFGSPINYDEVNRLLEQEKNKSIEFLTLALNKSLDKDLVIEKLKKSLDEKNKEIERLRRANLFVIQRKVKFFVKELLWNSWLFVFRLFPSGAQSFIRKNLRKDKY